MQSARASAHWYHGWNIVAAGSFITLLSVGMRLGFGPFFLPMVQDLGFSRSLLSTALALGMFVYGLGMPLAGWLVGRWGTPAVLLTGAGMVAVAAAWTVQVRSPAAFMLSFGVLMSIGLSFTSPVALTPVISRWFTRERGRALLFLSTGSMAGMALMTPVLAASIDAVGWRVTLGGYAALLVLLTVPVALRVIRDKAPAGSDTGEPGPGASAGATAVPSVTLRQVMRSLPFWMIVLGMFACGFSMNLLGTHGMPMLMDHGFDATGSSLGIGLIGFVAIFGTLMLGRVADRFAKRKLLAMIYGVRGLGFFALVAVGVHWELYLAATLGGIVWAGSIALSSAILADVYGVRLVGVLYGLAFVGHQVGGTVSAWLGGFAYEAWGTHWIAFGGAGVLLLLAAALSLQLPRQATRPPRLVAA
jgi:MFS family permease